MNATDVVMNGKTTVDYVDAKRIHMNGHIALQLLSDDRQPPQKTVVQFRKIEVQDLTSSRAKPNAELTEVRRFN